MKFIGISGKPGSNKMFFAFRIIQELKFHGYNAQWVRLTDPLYQEFNAIADFAKNDNENIDDIVNTWELGPQGYEFVENLRNSDLGEKNPVFGYNRRVEAVRKGLTFLAVDIRREQNPDYFINKLAEKYEEIEGFGILTDLRFVNEAEYINAHDGLTIRVESLDEDSSGGYKYQEGKTSVAETALDNYSSFFGFYINYSFDKFSFMKELSEWYDLPLKEENFK